jgi:hypothetical protein
MSGEVVPFEASETSAARRPSGDSFRWSKAGVAKVLDASPVWTVALNLMSSGNRRRGILTVHRLYSSRDLQLDINLLTSSFPTALADALDRTLAHSAQVIALPDQSDSMVAAQAG